MRRLSPDLLSVARLIATGQVLLCSPSTPALRNDDEVLLVHDPKADLEAMALSLSLDYTKCDHVIVADQPKEPWRRGRPLR